MFGIKYKQKYLDMKEQRDELLKRMKKIKDILTPNSIACMTASDAIEDFKDKELNESQ